jgi:phospholipid/cholesterol/gamma-HCH transport system permease protein
MQMPVNFLANIGSLVIGLLQSIGKALFFMTSIIIVMPYAIKRFNLLLKQIYFLGVLSLPIILTAGFFVGMVLSLQGYLVLVDFNSEEAVGSMTALSLIRELGPVVTGLLFAGRAGSALTAEIGLMRSTEQISALEMMAVDPNKFVYAPRLAASIIVLPMLSMIFVAVGIIGSYLISVGWLGVYDGFFWTQMQTHVDWNNDVINGIIKSIFFAVLVALVSLFQGVNAIPTSEGVSRATTKTVVHSSLGILGLDFLLTVLMF